MKCPNCGSSVTDGAHYCQYCGADLSNETKHTEVFVDQARIAETIHDKEIQIQREKTKRLLIIVISVFIVALITACLLIPDLGSVVGGGIAFFGFLYFIYRVVKLDSNKDDS